VGAREDARGGGVTAPSEFEVTPMTWSEQQWWDEYCKCRAASARCDVVDPATATPQRALRWPQALLAYDGWGVEQDNPEPDRARLP
jgi:hypothetical protein